MVKQEWEARTKREQESQNIKYYIVFTKKMKTSLTSPAQADVFHQLYLMFEKLLVKAILRLQFAKAHIHTLKVRDTAQLSFL